MDDETLIIPSRPIPSKAVINFAELHQIRDILYVPTDSYTMGTAALSRWGRLAVHTKYSCSPFPPLSFSRPFSLFVSLSSSLHLLSPPQCLVYVLSHTYLSPSILPLQCLWLFIYHTLLPLPLSSPPLILLSVLPHCCCCWWYNTLLFTSTVRELHWTVVKAKHCFILKSDWSGHFRLMSSCYCFYDKSSFTGICLGDAPHYQSLIIL